MTTIDEQRAKARRLRALVTDGPLVLANAWDAGSAVLSVAAGVQAVATTSAGVSWSLGRGDGEHLSRTEMVAAASLIIAAVDVPVTVDAEGGYGLEPHAVAETVTAVIEAGGIGVNLEDSIDGVLLSLDAQRERLAAARAAASAAGLPEFVINARTDVYLLPSEGAGHGHPSRLAQAIERAVAYADAGADSVFPIGLSALGELTQLVDASPLPVNASAGPGGPTIGELAAVGVNRISLGASVAEAAYTLAFRAAQDALGVGTYDRLAGTDGFSALDSRFG
jgi:2-methylisocitrate lyase-like PEP mutase family enzyme